LSKIF